MRFTEDIDMRKSSSGGYDKKKGGRRNHAALTPQTKDKVEIS